MQHDHILKKLKFDPPALVGVSGGGGGGGERENIRYHVAAFV